MKIGQIALGAALTVGGLIFALLGIGEEGVSFGAATPIVAGQEYIAAGMMVTGIGLMGQGAEK